MEQLNNLEENVSGLTDEEMANKNKIDYEYIPGDVNQDGVVNIADLIAINMYLLNPEQNSLTEVQLKAADVADTGNGKIDTSDSALLMNYICGILQNIPA